jgi:putative phosphoribosyl transferase
VARLEGTYDQVIVLAEPQPFSSVGQWYRDFHQVSDAEVSALLAGA